MNLPSVINNGGAVGRAGAVELGGSAKAAPVNFEVGAVGFGPTWSDYEEGLREMYDAACRTIVRMECEADELRAANAVAEQERAILVRELERLREMVADERARDEACRESCRDKAQADGGWASI
jgi:hypothetical protein